MRAVPGSTLLRLGAFLAILIGVFGVFVGLSGAATFIPYRVQNGTTLEVAQALTALSALAAVLSAFGATAGIEFLRDRSWALVGMLTLAVGCIATVGAFALVMPPSVPSPVPGGAGTPVLFSVVTAAYGTEIALLLLGRRAPLARGPPATAA